MPTMRFTRKLISLLLMLTVCLQAVPIYATDDAVKKTMDNMVNNDAKLRVSKFAIDQIKEDRAAGRSIQWGKIKEQVTRKPIMTQLGLDIGSQALGSAVQYATMGIAPPFGVVIGTVAKTLIGSTGGALGYETSKVMEEDEASASRQAAGLSNQQTSSLSKRQLVGRALQKIDAPALLGKTTGSVIGALIGQAICPIPFLGIMLGSMAGGFIGGLIVNKLRNTGVIGRGFDKLQSAWQKVGAKVAGDNNPKGTATAPAIQLQSTTGGTPAISSSQPAVSAGDGKTSALVEARAEVEALYRRYETAARSATADSGVLKTLQQQLDSARERLRSLEAR